MKKIITAFIIIAMSMVVNNASAEITATMMTKQEVTTSIMEVIPMVSQKEIDSCYTAMKDDGFYRIHSSRVRIVCSKEQMVRVWQ